MPNPTSRERVIVLVGPQSSGKTALLEAILCLDWEYRYFSFDAHWSKNQEMASMRDGSGGHWFLLFTDRFIAYKCISPEDGLIDNLDELSEKQREVISRRFGLRGFEPTTLEAVGQEIGLTRERVRQIQVEALRRLRQIMMRHGVGSETLHDE